MKSEFSFTYSEIFCVLSIDRWINIVIPVNICNKDYSYEWIVDNSKKNEAVLWLLTCKLSLKNIGIMYKCFFYLIIFHEFLCMGILYLTDLILMSI